MSPVSGQTPLDRAIAWLATRQHGVVGMWQLHDLGLSTDAAAKRVAAGRLHRMYRGVYAVGHPVLKTEGHLMAAVLAGGPRAVLSHVDAAELHGIRRRGYVRTRIHVTSSTRAGRRHKRLVIHSGAALRVRDVMRAYGIPCTSVPRTLLDLAETGPVTRDVERAEALGLFDLTAVNELLDRSNGRRGANRLRAAIQSWE